MGQFSNYQMNRLLKRRSVQVSLQEAEKEMGGRTFSLGDVEALLVEQGIQTSNVGQRIASDNVTRYVYVTGKNFFLSFVFIVFIFLKIINSKICN